MNKPIYVIITAGGSGSRMGSAIPKQFLELEGKPILQHTLELFLSIPQINILLVLPQAQKEYWKQYCLENKINIRHRVVCGGVTRFHSVKNALEHIPDNAIVAVHDGVRPLVPKEMLRRLFRFDFDANSCNGLIPVTPVVESLRQYTENGESIPVDRSRYCSVQTPQIFTSTELKRAYKQAYTPSFTDDASVMQSAGYKIKSCQGSRYNIKITTPEDLSLCKQLLPLLG